MKRHVPVRTAAPPEPCLPESIRKLWVATLEGAITDLRWAGEPNASLDAAHPGRERAWLFSDAVRPGSYVWICRLLELEPSYLRRGILASVPCAARAYHTDQVRRVPKMGHRAGRTRRERTRGTRGRAS